MNKYNGDVNSSNNQRIKAKLVEREVIMLASDIVDVLYSDSHEDIIDAINEAKSIVEIHSDDQDIAEGERNIEVFEWYFVNEMLADDLEKRNEVIVRHFNSPLWGRQGTGQAILLDSVISEIATDMEILEGQVNEWKL